MSQDPPRRDMNLDDRTLAGAPGEQSSADETMIGSAELRGLGRDVGGSGAVSGSAAASATGAPSVRTEAPSSLPPCPGCGQIPEHESQFCQSCGLRLGAPPADQPLTPAEPPAERLRPWMIAVGVVWAIIMVAALYFIFANAIMIGSI